MQRPHRPNNVMRSPNKVLLKPELPDTVSKCTDPLLQSRTSSLDFFSPNLTFYYSIWRPCPKLKIRIYVHRTAVGEQVSPAEIALSRPRKKFDFFLPKERRHKAPTGQPKRLGTTKGCPHTKMLKKHTPPILYARTPRVYSRKAILEHRLPVSKDFD